MRVYAIIKINQSKSIVLDYYYLATNVSDLDLHFEYLWECECKMELCGELIDKLYDLLAEINIIDDIEQLEYLKNEFNFIPFDTRLIFNFM